MKEILRNLGWENYRTGCPCNGLPRYFRHTHHSDYIIIIRGSFFSIKKSGVEIAKGREEIFTSKLNDYGLIAAN